MPKHVQIHLQLGAETVSDHVPAEDLPADWDQLTHDQKAAHLREAIETLIANEVGTWFTETD